MRLEVSVGSHLFARLSTGSSKDRHALTLQDTFPYVTLILDRCIFFKSMICGHSRRTDGGDAEGRGGLERFLVGLEVELKLGLSGADAQAQGACGQTPNAQKME